MTDRATYHHPLRRSGTHQNQRFPYALEENYVQIDERSFADLILFQKAYASFLQFYNLQNLREGDWTAFVEKDVSTIIATLAAQEGARFQQFRDALLTILRQGTIANENVLKIHFKFVFDFVFTLVSILDRNARLLPDETGLKEFIRLQIQSRLKARLQRLLSYYKAGVQVGLIDESSEAVPSDEDFIIPVPLQLTQEVLQRGLSPLWINNETTWPNFLAGIVPDATLFGDLSSDVEIQLFRAATFNLLTSAIEGILRSYVQVIQQAGQLLNETLALEEESTWPDHGPNNALFLAFLKLFRNSQDHLNTLTRKHLDFYYREVLQLKEKSPSADQVHVIFEPTVNQSDVALEKGQVLLKAGKDAKGHPVSYELAENISVNEAQVEQIQAVRIDDAVYYASIANSKDGQGGAFEKDEVPSWHPFALGVEHTGEIGFAVASNHLFLKEGRRVVEITVVFEEHHSARKPNSSDTREWVGKCFFTGIDYR